MRFVNLTAGRELVRPSVFALRAARLESKPCPSSWGPKGF